MVSKESIQQELERILASSLFNGKKQASKFLQYIVMETLQERGDRITQYGIAIEALGKSADYNPTESPAVRVEAGRVRKLLDEYYATEGSSSSYRIELPTGGYTPNFKQADTSQLPWRRLGAKRVQSTGPKIYIASQNPISIRHDGLRSLVYDLRSTLPVMLGKLRTIQIALTDPGHYTRHASNALEYAWQHHQAEFLLQSEASLSGKNFNVRYVLIHTLSREVVWSGDIALQPRHDAQTPTLDPMYQWLMTEVFSLHQGAAMTFWSRYWHKRGQIPSHYQILVEHIRFIQESFSEVHFRDFWIACEKRTRHYNDDSLAHLHYAMACFYAYMLKVDMGMTRMDLEDLWQRQALSSLELNPGNALAHAAFALNCYARGEVELCNVEIQTARNANPLDIYCGRFMAVGLCALGSWESSFALLKTIFGYNSSYPDPLRTVPCLYYFRRSHYSQLAVQENSFNDLGGWNQFGKLVKHCQSGHCQGCLRELSHAVDFLPNASTETNKSDSLLWTAKENVALAKKLIQVK